MGQITGIPTQNPGDNYFAAYTNEIVTEHNATDTKADNTQSEVDSLDTRVTTVENDLANLAGLPQKIIYVNQSTLSTELGGTIDSTVLYVIDGDLDFTGVSIEVPATHLFLAGHNLDLSVIRNSEASYTLFTSPVGGSGSIFIKDLSIEISGASSQVFNVTDATGNNAIEMSSVNFNNCTSRGEMIGYRQGLELGTGYFGGTPELTLTGTWGGGYLIQTSIVRSLTDGGYSLFKAGTGFTMNSRFKSNQNVDLPASASYINFSASNFPNPSTLQLQNMEITRNGVYDSSDTNISPNIDRDELPSYWKNNNGIANTYVGATTSVTSEVLTVVAAGSTWYDLEGIFITTGAQHFTGNADGELTHDGIFPNEFTFTADLVIEGNTADEISVRFMKYDDSASTFVPLDYTIVTRPINALVGGRDVAFIPLLFGGVLDQNDYLKMQVRNNSGNNNVTLESSSFLRIQER